MISTIDSNKGMLSVRGIKGVEIVDIPVEPELPVSCRVILWGFLEGQYVTGVLARCVVSYVFYEFDILHLLPHSPSSLWL